MINIQYNGPNKYSGGSFMDGSTEKMFFGEVYGADQKLGIGGTTSGSNLYAGVGNDYIVIARYDFGTDVGSVVAYKIGTDAVPLTEPSTWHATYTDSSLSRIDGLRIASGAGAGSGTPGNTYFDELRVATNWSELLGVLAAPEIAVLGTNGAAISDGDLTPSTADGTDFGNTTVAVGLTERIFGITNSGSGLLNISGVTTGGAHAADFIVWSYPAIVSPGAISNLVVRFDPAALGGRTGTIVIANDDGDEASYDFAVQGTGVASTQNVIRFQGAEGTTNDNWSFSVNAGYGSVATPNDAMGQTGAYSIRLVGSNASNSDPTVTFDGVDVRGLSNVAVSVAFAASGADTGDDLYLELSYDNGATWGVSSQLVDGLSNYSTNFFGTDPVRTVGSNPFVLAVAATATQVRIRVRFDEAAAGDNRFDEYYVDDVSLLAEGTRPVITFGTGSVVIAEGDAGRAIPVTISSAADATVRVYVAGTAQAGGTDFSLSATTIVFAAGGATTSNLTITVADDVVEEGPELARLTLVDAAGGVIQGADEFLLQIRDSDAFALMTANLVSGTNIVVDVTPYDEPANRMFQLLRPDVVAIQEWTVTNASLRAFVDVNFGTNFHYIVEPESGTFNMPNGVISRWPIVATGEWTDVEVDNRDFAWATIDLPGPKNLHVVSVHFKAGSTGPDITTREAEARALTNYLATAGFPASDFLVVAGDLNLTGRVENALAVLTNMVSDATRPADQDGDEDTNRGRSASLRRDPAGRRAGAGAHRVYVQRRDLQLGHDLRLPVVRPAPGAGADGRSGCDESLPPGRDEGLLAGDERSRHCRAGHERRLDRERRHHALGGGRDRFRFRAGLGRYGGHDLLDHELGRRQPDGQRRDDVRRAHGGLHRAVVSGDGQSRGPLQLRRAVRSGGLRRAHRGDRDCQQ
jgi:endonuclease/exonuclease/phosphatase family metal-dependent hydrolase